MATFIRDLSDYKVHMDTATSDGYSFTVTSKWSVPDINDLNRRIDERENQLKQEVGHDYTQLYKRIIDELPDLIRQTPKTTTIKENKSIFKVGRIEPKAIEKNYHFSELNLLDDDFRGPYLKHPTCKQVQMRIIWTCFDLVLKLHWYIHRYSIGYVF